ncbi:hypothetical protein [Phyllobacterium salinisoli]|uniref:hypothetical protein n=1 Tax=Phyllobacterium salinisoli TaxID=1899321 RepID=UPI00190F7C36|nr:hypothetical protein [Phyllobacterium salinisoli]
MITLVPIDAKPRDFSSAPLTDDEAGAVFRAALNLSVCGISRTVRRLRCLILPVRTYRRWKAGELGAWIATPTALEPDGYPQNTWVDLP